MSDHYTRDPKIVGSTEAIDKDANIRATDQFQVEPRNIPRNIMDEITKLAGDGKARVTVSADFGFKNYGSGVTAMCSVTLTCNQDEETIDQATKIAGDLARAYAKEQMGRADADFKAMQTRPGSGPQY